MENRWSGYFGEWECGMLDGLEFSLYVEVSPKQVFFPSRYTFVVLEQRPYTTVDNLE